MASTAQQVAAAVHSSGHVLPVPRVPDGAVPRLSSDGEVVYMAGSALNSLDDLVRSNAPWLGAAGVTLMRRVEEEPANPRSNQGQRI